MSDSNPRAEQNRSPATVITAVTGVAAVVVRVVSPWLKVFNVAPVGALGLYGGAKVGGWKAYALPLAVMAVSDLAIYRVYGYQPFSPWVYGAFLAYPAIGWMLKRTNATVQVGLGSFLGALVFYLVTNFAVWRSASEIPSSLYEPNAAGLLKCYVAALPFFGYTLAGDLGFSTAVFGAHAWLTRTVEAPKMVAEHV